VTWYSKILAVVVFVVVFCVAFRLGIMYEQIHKDVSKVNTTPTKEVANIPISITTKDIKEENFTGTEPVIAGSSAVAKAARAYVSQRISDFRKEANAEVPAMKKEFGAGSPPAQYEIDINASYIKSTKTESIVLTDYTFTGGAHGNTLYKVFTASRGSGKILNLSSVVKKEEQTAFTDFVKKQLDNWKPDPNSPPPVFPDQVAALPFNSFVNWSFDENAQNLIIYFGQYDIGPGVLGEVPFQLPIDQIKSFLNSTYLN